MFCEMFNKLYVIQERYSCASTRLFHFNKGDCAFQDSTVYEMKSFYPDIFNGVNEAKIVKQNFLKAAIFYDDLSHEMVSEVPMYTVSSVLFNNDIFFV